MMTLAAVKTGSFTIDGTRIQWSKPVYQCLIMGAGCAACESVTWQTNVVAPNDPALLPHPGQTVLLGPVFGVDDAVTQARALAVRAQTSHLGFNWVCLVPNVHPFDSSRVIRSVAQQTAARYARNDCRSISITMLLVREEALKIYENGPRGAVQAVNAVTQSYTHLGNQIWQSCMRQIQRLD